jgi:hypothetical protein
MEPHGQSPCLHAEVLFFAFFLNPSFGTQAWSSAEADKKSPQGSRLEFLRAYTLSLEGSLQLGCVLYYRLIHNQ